MFRLVTVLLFAVYGLVLASKKEAVLVTSETPSRSNKLPRDSSYSVTVTIGTTNMNTTMANDATNTMAYACREYDTVSDQETYFRTTFGGLYPTYSWSIFENCGTFALYTNYYISLTVTVNSAITNKFLIFSS